MNKYLILGLISMHIQSIPHKMPSPAPAMDDQNMFNAIYTFPEQMEEALKIGTAIKLQHSYKHIKRILFAGMGGSSMSGAMTKALVQHESPIAIDVHQNYDLPQWVNNETLVICISYSGNTEETLSCFQAAQKKHANIIGVTSGGALLNACKKHNYDVIEVTGGLPPRAALGYLSVPLICLMEKLGITKKETLQSLRSTIADLKNRRTVWSEQSNNNPAYRYASQLSQFMPVIYGEDSTTGCIALRWKAQFAENSKMIARTHMLPELDHNEIVGWCKNPELLKRSVVIWLLDPIMHPRNQIRQKITHNVISNAPAIQLEFAAPGQTWCERMFYLVHLGDWISYWCALAHDVNPTTIKNIDTLKKRMRTSTITTQPPKIKISSSQE